MQAMEIRAVPVVTWCSLASTDEVEAGRVDNAGLPSPGEIQLQRHLEEHEGGVDAVLVQFQQVAQGNQPPLSCKDTNMEAGPPTAYMSNLLVLWLYR